MPLGGLAGLVGRVRGSEGWWARSLTYYQLERDPGVETRRWGPLLSPLPRPPPCLDGAGTPLGLVESPIMVAPSVPGWAQ